MLWRSPESIQRHSQIPASIALQQQLTLSWPSSVSHRNQSNDLLCKSVDWFLYGRNSFIIELKVLRSFVCGSLQYTSSLYNTFGRIVIWIKNIFSFFRHLRKKDWRQKQKNLWYFFNNFVFQRRRYLREKYWKGKQTKRTSISWGCLLLNKFCHPSYG